MTKPTTVMDIFSQLDKSNCGECGEKTCLAFASYVFQGRRSKEACPRLPVDLLENSEPCNASPPLIEMSEQDVDTRNRIIGLDLADAALRTGGLIDAGRLVIKILGKDFAIDREGDFFSDIHIIPWLINPFICYVLNASRAPVIGEWISFRDIPAGWEYYPLFQKRAEEPLRQVADRYPALFNDIVSLFQGQETIGYQDADVSVILPVFPKLPVLISYYHPMEGIESALNIHFDKSASSHVDINALFTLGAGLSQMFGKIAANHQP